MTVIFNAVNPSDASGNWYFPATAVSTGAIIPPYSLAPGQVIHMTLSTTAAAHVNWAIQHIRHVYGAAGAVDEKGFLWRARPLGLEELMGDAPRSGAG